MPRAEIDGLADAIDDAIEDGRDYALAALDWLIQRAKKDNDAFRHKPLHAFRGRIDYDRIETAEDAMIWLRALRGADDDPG